MGEGYRSKHGSSNLDEHVPTRQVSPAPLFSSVCPSFFVLLVEEEAICGRFCDMSGKVLMGADEQL